MLALLFKIWLEAGHVCEVNTKQEPGASWFSIGKERGEMALKIDKSTHNIFL